MDFLNRKLANHLTVNVNGAVMSYNSVASYLSMTLDTTLR